MRPRLTQWSERQLEFRIGDARYTTSPIRVRLPKQDTYPVKSLVTVISAQQQELASDGWLERMIHSFEGLNDDVWSHDFLEGVLIQTRESVETTRLSSVLSDLKMLSSWCDFISGCDLQTGPYVVTESGLAQVYRLHDDTHGAFMVPIKPYAETTKQFESLDIAGEFPQSLSIAVPSRLISLGNTGSGPLCGKRMAVKDLFAIAGLRMALSNRAFLAVSDPAERTAPLIQALLDTGVTMLGTTKCSSMISREDPTEAVDFQAPWNPRGDGYQSPVGSSSGTAAGVAAYEWLDFAIGSDTTGSSRRPAFVNGCFQHRFSYETFPLEGVFPCFARFDAPALFSRCLEELDTVVKTWISQKIRPDAKPTRLIYPIEYLPVGNPEQQALIDQIIEDVASTADIYVERLSIKQSWQDDPPSDADGEDLETYLKDAGLNTFVHDFAHNHDDFRAKYTAKYDRTPYVNKVTQWRWDVGCKIEKTKRDEALRRMNVYKDWVLQTIFKVETELSIITLPIMNAEPNYRDIDPGMPFAQDVWDPLWLSPVTGGPETSVLVGQLPYESRITKREEYLPIAVSFVSAPGTDVVLTSTLLSTFREKGRPMKASVGRNIYK